MSCLDLEDAPEAPTNLAYSSDSAIYTLGDTIQPNILSVNGSVSRFSISPSLPPQLTLDGKTGIITGTMTELAAPNDYLVTAENTGGKTTAIISITTGKYDSVLCPTTLVGFNEVLQNGSMFTITCNTLQRGLVGGKVMCIIAYGCTWIGCIQSVESCLKGCREFRIFY